MMAFQVPSDDDLLIEETKPHDDEPWFDIRNDVDFPPLAKKSRPKGSWGLRFGHSWAGPAPGRGSGGPVNDSSRQCRWLAMASHEVATWQFNVVLWSLIYFGAPESSEVDTEMTSCMAAASNGNNVWDVWSSQLAS